MKERKKSIHLIVARLRRKHVRKSNSLCEIYFVVAKTIFFLGEILAEHAGIVPFGVTKLRSYVNIQRMNIINQ